MGPKLLPIACDKVELGRPKTGEGNHLIGLNRTASFLCESNCGLEDFLIRELASSDEGAAQDVSLLDDRLKNLTKFLVQPFL